MRYDEDQRGYPPGQPDHYDDGYHAGGSFMPGFEGPEGADGPDGHEDGGWDDQAGWPQPEPRGGRGRGRNRRGRQQYQEELDQEEEEEPERRVRRHRIRWMAPWIAALVILTPIAVGGYYAYSFYQSKYHPADFTGAGYGSVMVEVNSGDTATSLAPELLNNGVIASDRAFVLAAEHSTNTQGLVPGTFRMHKHMQATLAYAMLVNPANVVEFTARIPEGLRATDIIARLAAADPHISPSAYQQALKNLSALGLPPYAHGKPEGYLYPDTYQIQPNASALSVLQQMVQSFNLEAGAVNLTQNAHPDQVIIVASLVQAEGGSVSDYPKIARVIYNRLAQGMKLQLDSTVLYGLNTYGILARGTQLQSDSPYNTYKFKGLPPGPIDSPGAAAIQAALNPAAGNWLYFVTVDPKTKLTKFTSSYTQFLEFEQELRHNTTTGR